MFSRLWSWIGTQVCRFLKPDQGTAFVKLCSEVGLFKTYPDFEAEVGICCDYTREREDKFEVNKVKKY